MSEPQPSPEARLQTLPDSGTRESDKPDDLDSSDEEDAEAEAEEEDEEEEAEEEDDIIDKTKARHSNKAAEFRLDSSSVEADRDTGRGLSRGSVRTRRSGSGS